MADLGGIKNFVQLTPRVGTAGQPGRDQFPDIAAAGYRTVINLAMPDSENAIADEGDLVARQGMQYIHLPIDFAAPTASDARTFFGVMDALGDSRVFVHCALNLRVSAFMYLYLRHAKGFADADARSPLIEKWQPHMDGVWKDFLALERDDILAPGNPQPESR
ncbi:MAG: protein tyrosine phosphatase family protein [Myxococcota bacterium]|nr:protein tyrosine phosphatase family protein [Myxococcota bacterium]